MSYSGNGSNRNSDRSKRMHYSPNLLSCIDNAVNNTKLVEIEYESRESGLTNRKVEPMAMVYRNRKRHLVGYCHLREAWRTFRLDRICLLKLLDDNFSPREDFNLADFEDDYNSNEYVETNEDHEDRFE